jgi:hypothetical protein
MFEAQVEDAASSLVRLNGNTIELSELPSGARKKRQADADGVA